MVTSRENSCLLFVFQANIRLFGRRAAAAPALRFLDPRRLRHIFELAIDFVVQEVNAVTQTHGEISASIVVEITRGTSEAGAVQRDSRSLRHIRVMSAADVVEQPAG